MKKVGILNVQCVDNYGAVLLAYALQSKIEELGYRAEIIDYRPLANASNRSIHEKIIKAIREEGIKGVIDKVQRKLLHKTNQYSVYVSSEKKKKNFSDFRAQHLKRSKVYNTIGPEDHLAYDIYVVGSDVVWKPDRICSEESQIYFLEFTKGWKCRRISYAASIGTNDKEVLKSLEKRFDRLIQKFDCVSVREKSSVPYVERLYGRPVKWCIDPTFLLQKDDYEALIQEKGIVRPKKDYIYLYLFEDNDIAFDLVNQCSEKMGIPVICQCAAPNKVKNLLECSRDDGPIEFLERIHDAKYVITDSFHGTAFSIIFKRDFYTVSRGSISIRMQDLLSKLNLTDRYIESTGGSIVGFNSVNYIGVDNIVNEWRLESMNYLTKALSEIRGGGINLLIISIIRFAVAPRRTKRVAA